MNRYVVTGARLLLGLIFTVFGLNGILNFMPAPPMPAPVTAFMAGLLVAPYFLPVLAVSQISAGVLLLINKQVPLALLILAPICVQICFFHAFLTPGIGNLIIPALVVVLGIITARAHWEKFRPLFA